MSRYWIKVSVQKDDEPAMTFEAHTDTSGDDYIPPEVVRRWFERQCSDVVAAALDKLIVDKLPALPPWLKEQH